MSDNDGQYLDAFGAWLAKLGEDAEQLSTVLSNEDVAQVARQSVAGGLNYLFKSLDLIPDGIDDIGYLDDAFVLRVAARHAAQAGASEAAQAGAREAAQAGASEAAQAGASEPVLARLGSEANLVSSFLADNYARLDRYVMGLRTGAARGRTVQEILASEKTLEDFLADVRNFAGAYSAPSFSRDPKSLIKLRAFFDAKLPK